MPPGGLLPDFTVIAKAEAGSDSRELRPWNEPLLAHVVEKVVKSKLPSSIGSPKIRAVVNRILRSWPLDHDEMAKIGEEVGIKSWSRMFAGRYSDNAELVGELNQLGFANWIVAILYELSATISETLDNTLYIGPARAPSVRFYRYQNLAVSEIDSDGKNFPMFLNSLRKDQIADLSSWIERLFGYGVSVENSGGHVSINVISEGKTTNIVDTGYGVSQILPVLGQIWWAARRPQNRWRTNSDVMVAIEQPELHLHPAHQALLADALAGVGTIPRSPDAPVSKLRFLIETHSEALINRFGELISKQMISPDNVQILIFDDSKGEGRVTQVTTAQFGVSGELIDWPYGFFQPNY
jgi:hypothetical protein